MLGPPVDVAAGSQLVVYNLGLPGADAYSGESPTRADDERHRPRCARLRQSAARPFPFRSPGNRFQVVTAPVTYAVPARRRRHRQLRRYTDYPIQATQPAARRRAAAGGAERRQRRPPRRPGRRLLLRLRRGPSARIGIVTLYLTLAAGGERLTLVHQVHVDNSP